MRLVPRLSLATVLMLLPLTSLAMTETVWNFRGGQVAGGWRYSGTEEPRATSEGLLVKAVAQNGSIISPVELPHATEVVSVTFISGVKTPAEFLWHRRGDPEGNFIQLPFVIPDDLREHTISLNVDGYPQWDRRADMVGFLLPKGANVLLREIRFSHWNWIEQAEEALRSFWVFDSFGPFSINFVWGPVISFNPVGTHELFTVMPSRGYSGMWLLYGALAAIAIGLTAHRLLQSEEKGWVARLRARGAPGHAMLFLLCYGALWIVLDIRMGAEMLTYVQHDVATWISQDPGSRTFRSYLNFNDIADEIASEVRGVETMGVLRSKTAPITAMLRYFVLPTLVVEPKEPQDDLSTWLIFERDDVGVNDEGRLTVGGTPWTKPGKIVQQFDVNSFLFQINE